MDVEYLPSIERAKLERRNIMSDSKKEVIEAVNEKMGLDDSAFLEEKNKLDPEFTKPDLDEIEERIDKMQDEMKCDQEEPMTTDRKIYMLSKIFKFAIGDRTKNLLDEEGIIDLVGLDRRGVLYLVQYKENNMRWETEENITKNLSYLSSGIDSPGDPAFKTDIPQKELDETEKSFKHKYTRQQKEFEHKYTGKHRTD